ncbi:hypothetical protein N9J84_05305 [Porticoccaceae bacterium]|nr:hypothetical protein [Porticoccaceae bacterium]
MITQYPERDLSGLNLAEGNTEYEIVHKFGRNDSVGTSFVPVSLTSDYKMPSAGVSLEAVSSDANDTSAGAGGRTLFIDGLGSDWLPLNQTVSLNGTSAVALPLPMTRITRAYLTTSGVYASGASGSHQGDITIQESGGGAAWARLESGDYPRGQTELAAYTVPLNKTAYIQNVFISVESTKSVSVILMHRSDANVSTAPFGASRIVLELGGVSGSESITPYTPIGPFHGPCDIYFLAKVSQGSAEIDIDFEIILKDT